jgi:cytochrome c-type biogenesis protein CcmH/NrfF
MIEHLEKKDFDDLTDQIKATNIGAKMMNHVLECPQCQQMSIALNTQIERHVRELEALT